MNDTGKPGVGIQVAEVRPGTVRFERVLELAARVLAQDRHLTSPLPVADESHVLAAFQGDRCAGFLRYLVQVIGAEEGRPPITHDGAVLREGYVEAFGVDPQLRRRGVGTALQEHAMRRCRTAGCFQMRSRSPVTSSENYALKLAAGYVLHPSRDNDSYYFLIRLLPESGQRPWLPEEARRPGRDGHRGEDDRARTQADDGHQRAR
ncbi:MAG TPA: GNAT family N-acetyltransferase [Trebonia sp.]|nr:GNAT family N-acetyltransferase [Trebonia sp.]